MQKVEDEDDCMFAGKRGSGFGNTGGASGRGDSRNGGGAGGIDNLMESPTPQRNSHLGVSERTMGCSHVTGKKLPMEELKFGMMTFLHLHEKRISIQCRFISKVG